MLRDPTGRGKEGKLSQIVSDPVPLLQPDNPCFCFYVFGSYDFTELYFKDLKPLSKTHMFVFFIHLLICPIWVYFKRIYRDILYVQNIKKIYENDKIGEI